MKLKRSVTAAVAAFVLALPAAAFAQSPSDQQYQDPFGSQGSGGGGSSGGGSSGGGSSGGGSGSSQSGSSSGSSSSGSTGSDASQFSNSPPSGSSSGSGATGPQLANTGQDTGLVALAGFGLLLAGTGLRLRVREAPRRPR
jgi:LPXTG-motif cell wall-anchored protein